MPQLSLSLASGEVSLSVRQFDIREATSTLFEVAITALSPDPDLDLGAVLAQPAAFSVASGLAHSATGPCVWTGVCSQIEQLHAEPSGLSTYALRLVPALWLATQRRNCRIFQHQSIPAI